MPRSNQDWWPNADQRGRILHAQSSKANPFGEDFDYAEEFASSTSRRSRPMSIALMTHSQDWWPADYGNYGRPVHPDELARRRHLPHLRRPWWRRPGQPALRPAEQLAGQREPGQGAPPAVAGQEEVRQQDLLGRPDGLRRQLRAGVDRLQDRSASPSAARTSGSPRRSSSATRTPGWAPTSATAASGNWRSPSAPPPWA